jgi:hypothetical protein
MFPAARNTALVAAAFILLVGASAASATPITYDFTVTATDGPLNGTVAHGSFSYDSSSITPGAINNATELLTALSFSWNGMAYNQTTANTGRLEFDASGDLLGGVFGSDCIAGGCSVSSIVSATEFYLVPTSGGSFLYAIPGTNRVFGGTVTALALVVPAPEPTTLTLLAVGLGYGPAVAALAFRAGGSRTGKLVAQQKGGPEMATAGDRPTRKSVG